LLVIEDNEIESQAIVELLGDKDLFITTVASGKEALVALQKQMYDCVVLDLGLPDGDGMNLLIDLRKAGDLAPILVLTARGDEAAKVAALDLGADDYVTKPFGVPELLARIRSALRHAVQVKGAPPTIKTGDVEIDLARRLVSKAGKEVRLPRREFDLLAALAMKQGLPVAHEVLLEEVWGSPDSDIRNLRVFMGLVREKIETDPARPTLLLSEPGFGYRLT
jgi:two-component system KDP operon response regulator KdpE